MKNQGDNTAKYDMNINMLAKEKKTRLQRHERT